MDVKKTDYAEGLVLPFEDEKAIGVHFLKTFPYKGPEQIISYDTKEFSPVCPYSGLPDFGELKVTYQPKEHILELKSFKYYLVSFRNVGIFQEPATARIFEDLMKLLKPEWLKVSTTYQPRGGIHAHCSVDSRTFKT